MTAALIDYSQKGFGDNVKRSHIALGLTVFTVGILSIVPGVSAAKPAEVDINIEATDEPFAPNARVSLSLPLRTSENLNLAAVTESSHGEPSASELNRQLSECKRRAVDVVLYG
jgi:hypothetical protein